MDEYINALISFEEASTNGDQKTAKKFYKLMDSCFRKLRDAGKLSELAKFLDHENVRVRLWVSTHLLAFNEELAKQSLKKLADDQSSFIRLDARLTLQEWNNGNLTNFIE